MEQALAEELERIVDRHVVTDDLNRLMKACIAEKARETVVWGKLTAFVHRMAHPYGNDSLPRAAVTELIVLALDIMDDLQDQDNPGKPWTTCPPAYASNAVLAFLMAGFAESARWAQVSDLGSVAECLLRSINGQQADLNESVRDETAYLKMAADKSGSLVRFAFLLGYAGTDRLGERDCELLGELGELVGVAAQLRNDGKGVTRVDVKNDLLNRKYTLPVLYLLEHATEDFPIIRDYYEHRIDRQAFVSRKTDILGYVERSGCLEYTEVVRELVLRKADEALSALPVSQSDKDDLRLLALGE